MENQNKSPSSDVLKQAIMDLKEPVIFRQILQDVEGTYSWDLLRWNLGDLSKKFGDMKLPFRVGYNAASVSPQWEVNCSTKFMTLPEFIQYVDSMPDHEKWYYFDYKYMQEWFKDNSEIMSSLNWNKFGFDKAGHDSTLWIGSKGAHTNCHQDSYGCNLIAQIHGRKQWLLFPPRSAKSLNPTRVPYEESTVYSKYNFFSPTEQDQAMIMKDVSEKPKVVILEKGDVLLVPSSWWHYVESLDLSISVNMWLPLKSDSQMRVKEAIVKLIVARIGRKVCSSPEDADNSLPYCMSLLQAALEECKNNENLESPCKSMKHITWTAKDLAAEFPNYIKLISDLEVTQLGELLKSKRDRFCKDVTELIQREGSFKITKNPSEQLSDSLVNALCHPDVINKAAELLLTS